MTRPDAVLAADRAPDHAVGAADPAVLSTILDPGITLAVWERRLPSSLETSAARLAASEFAGWRATLELDGLAETLPAGLVQAGMLEEPLSVDILHLARLFADVMRASAVDIRLDKITGDACRKFHADYVTARLITTYHGPATQWLDRPAAIALADGADLASLAIRSLATGDVACLKGLNWAADTAIVHRSPPIAGTTQRRLVLVINPAGSA